MIDVFFQASFVIKAVLLILASFSIMSWALILYKYLQLRAVARESKTMLESLRSCHSRRDLSRIVAEIPAAGVSPIARVIKSVMPNEKLEPRESGRGILSSRQAEETARLESYLTFLATTGSTAPFIGLLGTVWGIMDAFRSIGTSGSASLAVVSPAIAEALVTTAAGLAAAIPAVIAYNLFVNWVRKLTMTTQTCVELFEHLAMPETG